MDVMFVAMVAVTTIVAHVYPRGAFGRARRAAACPLGIAENVVRRSHTSGRTMSPTHAREAPCAPFAAFRA
jgi:hypothetical protein